MNSKWLRTVAAMGVLTLGLALGAGCASNEVTAGEVRSDLTPELYSVAETKQQHMNRQSRTWDYMWRQLVDDVNSALLLDEPSRMSRYPIP